MNRIRTFISYSSKQKIIGGQIRRCLTQYCGYHTFIAHDDIPAASIWEAEILKAIENCDIFIPLISDAFKASDFTDQETGIAANLKKKIIPIKLERINPYGFINKYQALQYKQYPSTYYLKDNTKELVLTIAQIVLCYEKETVYHQKAVNSIIHAFCNSTSYDSTNAAIEIMVKYDDFTGSNIVMIMNAIKNNKEVKGAFGLPKLKDFLHETYNISVD